MYYDTHCHLNSSQMYDLRHEFVKKALENNVTYMNVVGYSLEGSKKAVQIAEEFENVYAVVGIGPEDCLETTDEDLKEIEALLAHPKVVAVGEIGLDYHWGTVPKEKQQMIFRQFIRMANAHQLPVVIHSRDATQDTIEILKELKDIYEISGYKVIPVSNKLKLNIDKIKDELTESTVVFAGPSGVGKSSLLNEVDKNFELKTGEVSDKIKRGKHTTRHAELLKLECGGMVADTPGFSSLTLDDIEESELKEYFIEFDNYDECRFGSRCIHENEPSCSVKEAVENGEISRKRYDSYIQLLNEIRSGKRRY